MSPRVLGVAGARPNFMKIGPVHRALEASDAGFDSRIVHTGQHYDDEMSDVFFRQLGLPEPDVHLGVGSASHAVQTARIMEAFESVVEREEPDLVLVVGDVNSTVVCNLGAAKLHVPVAHVEAGLRSFDRYMPKEITGCSPTRGIREETTYLQVPCLTVRENTERLATVEIGTNELNPLDPGTMSERVAAIVADGVRSGQVPPLWDGHAAGRILDVIERELD